MERIAAKMQTMLAGAKDRMDDRGATAVEYGLMVALIAIAIIVAVTTLGKNLASLFTTVSGEV